MDLGSSSSFGELECTAEPNYLSGSSPHGIFAVPLHDSILYANVAISLFKDDGASYIYGYVPIVVAKCGVFLKEKGEVKLYAW